MSERCDSCGAVCDFEPCKWPDWCFERDRADKLQEDKAELIRNCAKAWDAKRAAEHERDELAKELAELKTPDPELS